MKTETLSSENMNLNDIAKDNSNLGEIEFHWTGHPFVDVGLAVVLIYNEKENPEDLNTEDIRNVIEFASKLYVDAEWTRYLTRIFRNNNPILMLNPSMRKNRTSKKLEESLWGLFSLSLTKNEDNKCQICGTNERISGLKLRNLLHTNETRPKEITGDIFPLLGTGEARNFFPSANPLGADICAQCLFLCQFMPIGSYAIQNKKGTVMGILSISGYPYDNMMEVMREAVDTARYNNLFSNSREFKKPENFFFRKIIEITRKVGSGYKFWKNTSFTIHYFLNGNRSGEQWIEIINIPSSTLKFLAFAGEMDYSGWKNISNRGWIKRDKNNKITFNEIEKGYYSNKVYIKLLNGESILSYFYNRQEKKANTTWRLLKLYCMEVLGLNKESLEFIRDIGDKLVETIEPLKDNQLKKTIREIENAGRIYQFENFFIRLEKIRQQNRLPNAFLSFDEFSMLLTSYGEEINTSWFTVKNLLLFRIYEKLHNRLIKIDLEETEEIDTEMPFGGD